MGTDSRYSEKFGDRQPFFAECAKNGVCPPWAAQIWQDKIMVTKYLRAAMRGAKYELLEEGGYYGSIPGFDRVWADAASLEDCRDELGEVLEEWLLFRLSRQLPMPVIDGMDLV